MNKCACGEKGKKYIMIKCKDCIKNDIHDGFKPKEAEK